MEQAEVLRRIITILDKYTTRVENNVRYGKYPFITHHNGVIRLFHFPDDDEILASFAGWLMPVGIPFVMKYDTREMEVERGRAMGYFMGNALYIHDIFYDKFVESLDEKMLYCPSLEDFIYVAPGGWSVEEQKSFGKYLWQLTTKVMSGDFREVTDINFEAALDIKTDILFRDGWIANRLAGRNVFYGITDCAVEHCDGIEVENYEMKDKHIWYNKYLVVLDVTGGNGIQTFGRIRSGSCYHPHISSGGNLCRGNATRRIQDKLNTGQITEFFIFMKDFLMNYSDENPFFHIPLRGDGNLNGSRHLINKIYLDDSD